MKFRVEVAPRAGSFDARGARVVASAGTLGVQGVTSVEVRDLFFLAGDDLTADDVGTVVAELLCDPVVTTASVVALEDATLDQDTDACVIEVAPLPGTTDTEAESLLEAAHRLGVAALTAAGTGTQYRLTGGITLEAAGQLGAEVLANEVVERFVVNGVVGAPFVDAVDVEPVVEIVPILELDDDGLMALSRERRLSMNLGEMQAVQGHYRTLEREPRDAELEMFAQTWSEHCVHKTFKARVDMTDDGETYVLDSMFKSYIMAATEKANKPWLVSVFVDNAGIVDFVPGWQLAFKAETHNHPSALEPFGGANTGVGGVIRDVIGVSARPIATTDVLCFGPPDLPNDVLPEGVLHPRRVAHGVIDGVGDYGNKMGLPTVDGAIRYDKGYVANPLVYCGCVGLLPAGSHVTEPNPGDHVVVIGGRTGRDGLRGATFSSMEMDVETSEIAGTAVQIGHPIHEKQAMEVVLRARDAGLYSAITDCGAGGLSSAVGEMAEELGARIHLERIPLKYSGLVPWEIWLSEAQERMVLAVPDAHLEAFGELCAQWDVEMCAMGTFTGDGQLLVTYDDVVVVDLPMEALHEGIPQLQLVGIWERPETVEPELAEIDLGASLLELLATPNIRSKEDVVRTYDHEVQAGTLVKPFVGPANDGPGDAVVLRPLDVVLDTGEADGPAAVVSSGINPNYGKLDPYAMAWACVDEAVRNAVCVGADPDRLSLLDNFCWGNPNLPDRMGALVRCARGCHDAAVAYDAPFISGKDSLNNEYTGADGEKHAIPGTLLVSALSIAPELDSTCTMDFKRADSAIVVVGVTRDELGGSALYELHDALGANVPQPPVDGLKTARAIHAAMGTGAIRAAHDCSEGGLLVAVAEMCLAGRIGANLELHAVRWAGEGRRPVSLAFSETQARYVLEVDPLKLDAMRTALESIPHAVVGQVKSGQGLQVTAGAGNLLADVAIDDLVQAFSGHV